MRCNSNCITSNEVGLICNTCGKVQNDDNENTIIDTNEKVEIKVTKAKKSKKSK
jgi:hypothetical protein